MFSALHASKFLLPIPHPLLLRNSAGGYRRWAGRELSKAQMMSLGPTPHFARNDDELECTQGLTLSLDHATWNSERALSLSW